MSNLEIYNWMKKIPRTAKIGRGRRPSPIWPQRNFLNSGISKLDKHVVLLLINRSIVHSNGLKLKQNHTARSKNVSTYSLQVNKRRTRIALS